MATDRILIILGIGCVAAAVLGFLSGIATALPLAAIALLIIGGGALVAGWRLGSGAGAPDLPADGPPVSTRAATWATVALGLLGLLTLVIAFAVARGDATGHAIGHLTIGVGALTLFALLGLGWRPQAGSQAALSRRVVLLLLGAAAFGSFLESMGGAGYDATNSRARVPALAALHDVALPIAALGMPGLVIGMVAGVVVAIKGALRRRGV